ncbi:MAG: lipase [Treponema sp.]|nr:lipase [Treponema sp.]
MSDVSFTKWVACWGNATSITNRTEAVWAKDLTLRYPVRVVFSGSKFRFHFSNLTGTEDVKISKAFVALRGKTECGGNVQEQSSCKPVSVTLGQKSEITIPAGKEVCSDEIALEVTAGETVDISMYFADFTQMNAGTLVEGPLSKGEYAYGDFAELQEFPKEKRRGTNWFYFLNTVDILTEEKNRALICYGDSITAQSWPDYLAIRAWEGGFRNVSIIRRAVCGTRILRQYDCLTYAAYGLKGETRFPIEMNTAGADTVIIQHGINDIIHPVGVETNIFRPWSDMPTAEDLERGVENFYIAHAKKLGYKVWSGTLLPIFGWRTYEPFREKVRGEFNEWLRTFRGFDGCVDFDKALRDPSKPEAFAPEFDSGDHLHPSEKAYRLMADTVPEELLGES